MNQQKYISEEKQRQRQMERARELADQKRERERQARRALIQRALDNNKITRQRSQ